MEETMKARGVVRLEAGVHDDLWLIRVPRFAV